MNVTIGHPSDLTVSPGHVHGGRTLVYADGDDQYNALTLWISQDVAKQWIGALTPLAEGTP